MWYDLRWPRPRPVQNAKKWERKCRIQTGILLLNWTTSEKCQVAQQSAAVVKVQQLTPRRWQDEMVETHLHPHGPYAMGALGFLVGRDRQLHINVSFVNMSMSIT